MIWKEDEDACSKVCDVALAKAPFHTLVIIMMQRRIAVKCPLFIVS